MHAFRLALLGWSLLGSLHSASAKAPEPVIATPLNSPGDWVTTSDYPTTALRYDMVGTTGFKLIVNSTGFPIRCEIISSSGFDVLDTATCQNVMAKAQFIPARDRAGKPIEGTYSNRVRWVLPPRAYQPTSENFASMLLSIDEAGVVNSCKVVIHVPVEIAEQAELYDELCRQAKASFHPAIGLELRGTYQGPSAELEIQTADAFTPALRDRVLAPVPGHEQQALNIHRFTVTRDGQLGDCKYEEQRGNEHLASNFCDEAQSRRFDPPFVSFGEDGTAEGWHIIRVLLKNAN